MLTTTSGLVPPVIENQIEILTGDQLSSRDQRWSRYQNELVEAVSQLSCSERILLTRILSCRAKKVWGGGGVCVRNFEEEAIKRDIRFKSFFFYSREDYFHFSFFLA